MSYETIIGRWREIYMTSETSVTSSTSDEFETRNNPIEKYVKLAYLIIFFIAIGYVLAFQVDRNGGDPFEALRNLLASGSSPTSTIPPNTIGLSLVGLILVIGYLTARYRNRE